MTRINIVIGDSDKIQWHHHVRKYRLSYKKTCKLNRMKNESIVMFESAISDCFGVKDSEYFFWYHFRYFHLEVIYFWRHMSLRCNAESSLWKILIVCFLFQSEKEKNDIEKKMTSYRYQRMIWVSAGFLVYLLSMAAKFQKKRLHMILTKKVIRTWRKFLNLCSDGLSINKYNVKKYR